MTDTPSSGPTLPAPGAVSAPSSEPAHCPAGPAGDLQRGRRDERLARRLLALAAPAQRLLVVGDSLGPVADRMRAAGCTAQIVPPAQAVAALPAGAGWDAIAVVEPGEELGERGAFLSTAHAALGERGAILLALATVQAGTPETGAGTVEAWIVALSEAAFCVVGTTGDPTVSDPEGARHWNFVQARHDVHTVRACTLGDEAAILALFHRVFHAGRGGEHWRWKYRDDPFGRLRISAAFAPAGELLAHYAGYGVPFLDARPPAPRDLLAQQIGDTMTAPEARHVGRGETSLLGRTVRHFYARFCIGAIAFNYGFNRGNIQKFSQRFVGARRIEDVAQWALEPANIPPARSGWRRRLGALEVGRTTEASFVEAEWDGLLQRTAPAYGALIRRDSAYLRWRYLECPDPGLNLYTVRRRGRLTGWGVFRNQRGTLVWGDALFDPSVSDAPRALLAHAVAQDPAVRRVEAWFSPRPEWWVEALGRLGFRREAEPNELAVMLVPFTEGEAAEDLLRNWYYTKGDSDLF